MDHGFDQLLSAFVFIYINVTNCYSPCTVMKETDILLHGLLNRSLTMCRTESSVLWVILAKNSCCLVLDVCVSGCLYVQRPPPLTEQTWAPTADWGALIFLIHLGLQSFAITFNNVLYLLKRLHMHLIIGLTSEKCFNCLFLHLLSAAFERWILASSVIKNKWLFICVKGKLLLLVLNLLMVCRRKWVNVQYNYLPYCKPAVWCNVKLWF